jgi:opacity protein-like surface antigen
MKKLRLVTLLALSVTASAPLLAAPAPAIYAGADFGINSASTLSTSRNRPSFGATLGYRFNEQIAAEVFARTLDYVGDGVNAPKSHMGIGLVASVPLAAQWSLVGRLGVGRTALTDGLRQSNSGALTDASIGAGVRYAFGDKWAVKLEQSYLEKSKVRLTTVGVELQF